MATLLTKRSNTSGSVPLAAQLTNSTGGAELAVNTADKRLYVKDSGGNVVELGINPASLPTYSSGTANGVAYLNGSKVLTTGSALTFDGTVLASSGLTVSTNRAQFKGNTTTGFTGGSVEIGYTGTVGIVNSYDRTASAYKDLQLYGNDIYNYVKGSNAIWDIAGTGEAMRLTSTGLGIGTSSPSTKLYVLASAATPTVIETTGGTAAYLQLKNTGGSAYLGSVSDALAFYTSGSGTERMRLDSSGNLGLGVTPSAWNGIYKVLQVGSASFNSSSSYNNATIGANVFYNAANSPRYINSDYATLYGQDDGYHVWYTAPSGTAGNAITFSQVMTLDASGNLFVGATSSAAGKVVIKDNSSGNNLWLIGRSSDGTSSVSFRNNADSAYNARIECFDTGVMTFGTGTSATERARITSGGDLLVGTTSNAQGSGNGNKLIAGGAVWVVNAATADGFSYYNSSAAAYRFYVSSAGTISATNTTISAISDQRLKENIQDLDAGLDKIMALKPRKFDWKAGKGKDIKGDRGWIAQEFEQVFPDMIDTWKDEAPEGEEPYKSVRADLIPVLVKAIQEQQALIQSLTARIAALESNP